MAERHRGKDLIVMGRRAGSFSKLRRKKTEVGIKRWLSFQSGSWVVGG